MLFVFTAGKLAIEFYNNPQTRDANQGFMGLVARRELDGVDANFGMSREYTVSSPELDKFLESYGE